MATSSRRSRVDDGGVDDVDRFARRLRALASSGPIPLLVVRVRDLERIAWRKGRVAARATERRALRTFLDVAARTLRATDIVAHEPDSQDFVAALVSPTRHSGAVASASDCRATLARLSSAMSLGGTLAVETGWTILSGSSDTHLDRTIELALERGARENERYEFFGAIGHELRTPLTSLRGYLETLLEDDSLDAETIRRFHTTMFAETTRLERLVEGMFDIAMFDLRSGQHVLESTPIRASVSAALDALAPIARLRDVRLENAVGDDCAAIGADHLTQIVVNLVENAIKHGRTGGRVVVSTNACGPTCVEVRIDDDGPGVLAAEREAIFSLAQRGSQVRAGGFGLGLAVVRLMTERVGGEVDATASVLGGAQFRVRLPVIAPGVVAQLGSEASAEATSVVA